MTEDPDTYCITLENGECVSTDPRCMHNKPAPSQEPAAWCDEDGMHYREQIAQLQASLNAAQNVADDSFKQIAKLQAENAELQRQAELAIAALDAKTTVLIDERITTLERELTDTECEANVLRGQLAEAQAVLKQAREVVVKTFFQTPYGLAQSAEEALAAIDAVLSGAPAKKLQLWDGQSPFAATDTIWIEPAIVARVARVAIDEVLENR